jgi:hypothetical protein
VCKQEIEVFGTPMEAFQWYRELRTPCCGADMHYICRTLDLLSPSNIFPVMIYNWLVALSIPSST